MKWLVINADDFGWDAAVNAAVTQAHTNGILTSASLMVTGAAVREAVEFAKQHPRLGVGVHLSLVQARAAAPAKGIVGLADIDGMLPRSLASLFCPLALRPGLAAMIETELRAQIEGFLDFGLTPTHLDSHMHTHMHPVLLAIVARLAREFEIAFVRSPIEPLLASAYCSRHRLLRRVARGMIFGVMGSRTRRCLRRQGLSTADRAIGTLAPGQLTEKCVIACLQRLPEGVAEIFFHPATQMSGAVRQLQPSYRHAAELAALCSSRVRELIEQQGIMLTNFHELAQGRP